jgi:hypothetical protein
MNDPLAKYRKTPLSEAQTEPPKRGNEYIAFDAKDRVERLKIRHGKALTRSPGYVHLLDVAYDGSFGKEFMLTYSFGMTVYVEGRNLQGIVTALEMGTAEFIQEFDPDRWQMPEDDKAPFIESIKVEQQPGGPPEPENGKAQNEKARGRSLH